MYYPVSYYDLVFLIDISSTMEVYFQHIKETINRICNDAICLLKELYHVDYQMRGKIITYGDIGERVPIEHGEFYDLKENYEQFYNSLDNLRSVGRSTLSNGLEAIATAIKDVDWTTGGNRRRHVIILFSDKPALKLSQRVYSKIYPKDMPKDLKELSDWWEEINYDFKSTYQAKSGRMIVLAPNCYPWYDMTPWNRYWPIFSRAGEGLGDVELQSITDIFVEDDF